MQFYVTVNILRTGVIYVTYNPSYEPVTQGQSTTITVP